MPNPFEKSSISAPKEKVFKSYTREELKENSTEKLEQPTV